MSRPSIGETRKPRFSFLRSGLFNSVRIWDGELPAVKIGASFLCRHAKTQRYTRVDSTEGSGWMADNYNGTVCSHCGKIIEETRTY